MRHAGFMPPRRRRLLRAVPLLGLALTGWACQQPPTYFYGYSAPPCVPVVPAPAAPAAAQAGQSPTAVIEGGMTTLDAPGRTTTVIGSENPPRVVVSDPDSRPRPSWWLNSKPDQQVVSTNVEGAVSSSSGDPTVNR